MPARPPAPDPILVIDDEADLRELLDISLRRMGHDVVMAGSLAEARRIMGPDAMIGVTCHDDRDLAWDAAEAGADYVAFGAFFPTDTKVTTHRPPLDLLTEWQETVEVPCVAIGGITVETAAETARAGADFVAVSAGVWSYGEGEAAAVKAFNLALKT